MPYCFCGKNLTCSFTVRTRSSLALWAPDWSVLFVCFEFQVDVGRFLHNCWQWSSLTSFGDPSNSLCAAFTVFTMALMNLHLIDGKSFEDVWCITSNSLATMLWIPEHLEDGPSFGHHNRWYFFSRKQISQISHASFGSESMWQERWMGNVVRIIWCN